MLNITVDLIGVLNLTIDLIAVGRLNTVELDFLYLFVRHKNDPINMLIPGMKVYEYNKSVIESVRVDPMWNISPYRFNNQ